jgi:murein L,D-transpeptidase YafK
MQNPPLVKTLALMLACAFAGFAACKETPKPMDPALHPRARAAAAAARVRPALEHDLKAAGLQFGSPVLIRAFKEELILELFALNLKTQSFQLFRSYPIAASSGSLGPKLLEGDGQVPEGFYQVPPSAMKPDSRYHLAFNVGYPNAYDRALGRTGSWIMIHGNRVSIGCLAMTDEKIEEIYTMCAAAQGAGQAAFEVQVYPFRMTGERMAKARGSAWEGFWSNLKEGYDHFEKTGKPARVSVRGGRYQFRK